MLLLTIWKSVGLLSFDCPNQKLVECMVITAEMFGYISFNLPKTNKDISKEISQNKELIMKINNSFHVLLYILLIGNYSIKILCVNRTDNEKMNREGISNNIKKINQGYYVSLEVCELFLTLYFWSDIKR
jgi:membrane protein CcdC involved in cytochrome C biogenesis